MLLFDISILFSFLGFLFVPLSYKRVASHYRYLLLLKKSISCHNTIQALKIWLSKTMVCVCLCVYMFLWVYIYSVA